MAAGSLLGEDLGPASSSSDGAKRKPATRGRKPSLVRADRRQLRLESRSPDELSRFARAISRVVAGRTLRAPAPTSG